MSGVLQGMVRIGALERTAEGRLRLAGGMGHFLVAATILLVSAVGWAWTVKMLKLVMYKEAVPWPAAAYVGEDFRLLAGVPESFGPYVLAQDNELRDDDDNLPDGEVIIDPSVMESLKIGTSLDKSRRAERRSNWYLSRIYRDTRKRSGETGRYLQLAVYYYTGGLDTVPHVPDICLQAGGAANIGTSAVSFSCPLATGPWEGPIQFNRTRYELANRNSIMPDQRTDYYVFSLNGWPERDRLVVRAKLSNPWMKYCYFAKIEFAPLGQTPDAQQADEIAAEFLKHFLPHVLATLPMPSDIERLQLAEEGQKR